MNPIALTAIEVSSLQLLGAIVATGPRWRRILALFVALPNLFLAWQVPPEHTLWRAMIELVASFGYLRLLDLVLARRTISLGHRVWHVAALIDTTRMTYGRPALDARALLRALGYGALATGSAWVSIDQAAAPGGTLGLLTRWGVGVVFVYTLTDAAYASVTVVFRAMGIIVYELHRAPILARTVKEFWGARWARTVSLLLFTRTFKPLARRGMPGLGLLASFAASALLHAIVILPALGWAAAGLWGAYFLVQGALVGLEIKLGVARWSRPLAHAWVVLVMLATSPLFVEPIVRLIGRG
jgi:hypothetical protein